jgi:hypothetical protein
MLPYDGTILRRRVCDIFAHYSQKLYCHLRSYIKSIWKGNFFRLAGYDYVSYFYTTGYRYGRWKFGGIYKHCDILYCNLCCGHRCDDVSDLEKVALFQRLICHGQCYIPTIHVSSYICGILIYNANKSLSEGWPRPQTYGIHNTISDLQCLRRAARGYCYCTSILSRETLPG